MAPAVKRQKIATELPNAVWIKALSYAEHFEICRARQVCKLFKENICVQAQLTGYLERSRLHYGFVARVLQGGQTQADHLVVELIRIRMRQNLPSFFPLGVGMVNPHMKKLSHLDFSDASLTCYPPNKRPKSLDAAIRYFNKNFQYFIERSVGTMEHADQLYSRITGVDFSHCNPYLLRIKSLALQAGRPHVPFSKVTSLKMRECAFSDTVDLQYIPACFSALTELDLSHSSLSDEGVNLLVEKCGLLKTLNLTGCSGIKKEFAKTIQLVGFTS